MLHAHWLRQINNTSSSYRIINNNRYNNINGNNVNKYLPVISVGLATIRGKPTKYDILIQHFPLFYIVLLFHPDVE